MEKGAGHRLRPRARIFGGRMMSCIGTFRTCAAALTMSVDGGEADLAGGRSEVRKMAQSGYAPPARRAVPDVERDRNESQALTERSAFIATGLP